MSAPRLPVTRLAAALRASGARVAGLLDDNGPQWVAADLAMRSAGVVAVPLPGFFTPAQLMHAAAATGMDALVTPSAGTARALGFAAVSGQPRLYTRRADPVPLPPRTAKITFTSGTTGTPKGVCLGAAAQWAVARSLSAVATALGVKRHLCVLPLAVLLENVAGVYAALLADASFLVPPLAEVGVGGGAAFDPRACLAAIEARSAHSVIVLPQMLAALVAELERGAPAPASLRFVAVGGARVAPALLERARAAGLPAYEGYGLSECSSVVCLNTPGADRPGSVGRPLPHVQVEMLDGGEIAVRGAGFLGYLGEAPRRPEAPFATGDVGRLDGDGFLHVEGRRKHVLITSFGRNVAPEWPEAELLAGRALAQAAVFGEARPRLCAVLVPAGPAVTDAQIEAQVAAANARLPDYARIADWVRAERPFAAAEGTATANGRPRRDAIWSRYAARLAPPGDPDVAL